MLNGNNYCLINKEDYEDKNKVINEYNKLFKVNKKRVEEEISLLLNKSNLFLISCSLTKIESIFKDFPANNVSLLFE